VFKIKKKFFLSLWCKHVLCLIWAFLSIYLIKICGFLVIACYLIIYNTTIESSIPEKKLAFKFLNLII